MTTTPPPGPSETPSEYADTLNALDAMQQSPAYAVRRRALADAERIIISLERSNRALREDAERLRILEHVAPDHHSGAIKDAWWEHGAGKVPDFYFREIWNAALDAARAGREGK